MTYVDEDLAELLIKPLPLAEAGGISAQVIATGPTVRYSVMPQRLMDRRGGRPQL
jgi:cardiolipin synthase A/B